MASVTLDRRPVLASRPLRTLMNRPALLALAGTAVLAALPRVPYLTAGVGPAAGCGGGARRHGQPREAGGLRRPGGRGGARIRPPGTAGRAGDGARPGGRGCDGAHRRGPDPRAHGGVREVLERRGVVPRRSRAA